MKRHMLRNVTLLVMVLTGALFALPNFFPSDPALLVSAEDAAPLSRATVETLGATLSAAGLDPAASRLQADALSLSFTSTQRQRAAWDTLTESFEGYIVSFTTVPRLPGWLEALGLRPMRLGLDLRGGVQFVYEVDLEAVTSRLLEDRALALERQLLEEGIRAKTDVDDERIVLRVSNEAELGVARRLAAGVGAEAGERLDVVTRPATGGYELVLGMPPERLEAERLRVMEQNVYILRNRVDALGLSEPVVAGMGADRILVQIPGARDPAQVRRILSSTATIAWHLEDTSADADRAARTGRAPPGSMLRRDAEGRPILLHREVIAAGEQLRDARFAYADGQPVVAIALNATGANRMLDVTSQNVGRPLAVLLIEEHREPVETAGEPRYRTRRDETVIFDGRIANVFSSTFRLTGLRPVQAQDLAVLLRSGALAAPIYEISSGTVSPTLGEDNIRRGRNALVTGLALVIAFMAAYYRTFGWIANLALLVNLIVMLGLLSVLPAALTLPGIAGVVLTVGMAVDANVLIFERIRESLAAGKSPLASIDEGYRRAFSTIADANVTTLIAAVVLLWFGTGPIKGFAATLSLGVVTSMLTSIVGTRAVVDLLYYWNLKL